MLDRWFKPSWYDTHNIKLIETYIFTRALLCTRIVQNIFHSRLYTSRITWRYLSPGPNSMAGIPKPPSFFLPFSFCCHGYIAMLVAVVLLYTLHGIRMYCVQTEMELNVLERGWCISVDVFFVFHSTDTYICIDKL